jgi:hypothetical protein
MKSFVGSVLIPFALGIPLLLFGMKELYQVNKFVNRGVHADGIIVEMEKGPGILGKYQTRVRFQTEEGITIEFSPGNASNPPMYNVNDHVPVVYNPDSPNYAVINSFIEIWLGPVIYASIGLFLLIISSFRLVKSRPRDI